MNRVFYDNNNKNTCTAYGMDFIKWSGFTLMKICENGTKKLNRFQRLKKTNIWIQITAVNNYFNYWFEKNIINFIPTHSSANTRQSMVFVHITRFQKIIDRLNIYDLVVNRTAIDQTAYKNILYLHEK